MTKPPNPLFKKSLDIWFQYYKSKTGQNYVMDAKSGMHLKQLLRKVEVKVRERGFEPTEERVLGSLAVFLVGIQDKWILENLEIPIVNGKFNPIYSKISAASPFVTSSRISDIVANRNYTEGAAKAG